MALESRHEQRDPNALPIATMQVTEPAPVPAGNLPPEYTVPNEAPVLSAPLATPPAPVVTIAGMTPPLPFKYGEAESVEELYNYLLSTYGEHYIGKNNIQVNDIVLAQDPKEVMGFWKFNAFKYVLRYGKKGGRNRQDLLKALHYVILLMHLDSQLAASEKEST